MNAVLRPLSRGEGQPRVEEPSARYLVELQSPLVRSFDLLATAPQGVAKLRELILSLAVRGKLVPQVPGDEPAHTLIAQIKSEKERLSRSGQNRADKPLPDVESEDQPYRLPPGWAWARFGTVSINRDGERIPVSSADRERLAKNYDYYGASGVIDKIDRFLFDKTLMLIGEDGANLINRSTPIAFLAHGRYWVNNHAHVIDVTHPGLLHYLCLYINSISLEPYVTGTAQPKMNQAKLNSIPVALPPLAEQARIVARVEELMKLCDALQERGRLEAEQHARLVSTLFDSLSASENAEALAGNWQRIAQHFDLLLDRPEAIDAVEQTILQLALRGFLVQQSAEDEPATCLVTNALAAKSQLTARKKSISATANWTSQATLPTGWCWSSLLEIGLINPRNEAADDTAASFVQMSSIPVELTAPHSVEPRLWRDIKSGFTHFAEGDIGVAKITPCFENGKSTIFRSLDNGIGAGTTELHVVRPLAGVLSDYVLIFLKSPTFLREGEAVMTGSAGQKRLPRSYFENKPFPLPPLPEQHRIVARVQQLRALCAQLRDRLQQARHTQGLLAETLVQQTAGAGK